MKKLILAAMCAALLLTGCGARETADVYGEAEKTPYESLSGEGIGWGFVRKKGAPPEVPESQKEVMRRCGCYYIDEDAPKTLYLTFDEGYENGYTSKILDVLEKTQTSAAFFVTGPYLENQKELVQRMIDNGHIVGNHTVNHLNLPKQSVETVQKELGDLNKMCEEMYGYTLWKVVSCVRVRARSFFQRSSLRTGFPSAFFQPARSHA